VGFSRTVPRRSPGERMSPGTAAGSKGNFTPFLRRSGFAPFGRKMPFSPRRSRGRPMPSKTPPSSPGPRSTDSRSFSNTTGAPEAIPSVSSYTCTRTHDRSMRITSPRSPSSPTLATSNMAAGLSGTTVTTGPEIPTTFPLFSMYAVTSSPRFHRKETGSRQDPLTFPAAF